MNANKKTNNNPAMSPYSTPGSISRNGTMNGSIGSSMRSPYPKSPMSFIAKRYNKEDGGKGFSRPVAVCFALNYVVGTGFLVLPYVFVQAGVVLSIITVVASSIFSDMAKDYVLVSMARAEQYLSMQQQADNGETKNTNGAAVAQARKDIEADGSHSEQDPLLMEAAKGYQSLINPRVLVNSNSLPPDTRQLLTPQKNGESNGTPKNNKFKGNNSAAAKKLIVKDRVIELSSLSDLFLGKPGLITYTFFLSIYMYMMLWAYTSVFAQAMATSLPISSVLGYSLSYYDNYTFYAVVFGLIVCPLSLVEVEDQVVIQITLTVLRVFRLIIMIVSAAACPECFRGNDIGKRQVPLWRFSGIYILLPVVIAANLCHEALPDLSHPVQDKRLLGQTFRWTFICTGVIYSVLGASVGYCFGHDVEPSANLNWEAFQSPFYEGHYNWIFQATGYFVVISPALDVISAYPLNAIALGNNLMEVPWNGSDSYQGVEPSYGTRMWFRMISAIPPMIGALFVRDLGVITDYAGVAGVAVTFCITSAFFISSARYVDPNNKTFYDSYATTHTLAWSLLVFGAFAVLFVLYELVFEEG